MIRTGQLKLGTRLPSTRAFARELGVSRTTTVEAYRDLIAEGYLEAQIGAGTVVVQELPELFLQAKTAATTSEIQPGGEDQELHEEVSLRLSQRGMRLASLSAPSRFFTTSTLHPFRIGAPALHAAPYTCQCLYHCPACDEFSSSWA